MKKLNYSESFLNDVITKNFKPIHGALFKGLCVSLLLIFSSGLFAQTITCPSNVTVDAEAGLCGAIVNYEVTATPGEGGGPSSIALEDFEGPTFPGLGAANGAPLPTILPDPTPGATNGTNVLSVITNAAGAPWQQAELTLQSGFELDLTGTDKRVSVDWYSATPFDALVKVENGGPASATEATHPGGGWQTLVFDFNDPQDCLGVANGVYQKVSFFTLWDINAPRGCDPDGNGAFLNPFPSRTTYIDNIIKGVVVPFSEDFEGPPFPGLGAANGAPLPTILPDPTPGATNGTNVLSVITNAAGAPWQQAELTLQSGFELDLTGTDKRVSVDWYSATPFDALVKVENGGPASATEAAHPGGGWQTLVFDFNNPQDCLGAANGVYQKVSFFTLWDIDAPRGCDPDGNGAFLNPFPSRTTYIDNIREGAEDATVTIVSTPPSGSVFNVGTTTVTSIATDGSGSTATCSFDVTVVDNEALSIDCNVAGPQNALTNSSFENNNGFNTQGATDWAQFGPVFILDQNFVGTAQDGDFFLKMFSGNAGLFQDIPVTAGDNITGSVYMQNASFDPTGPVGGGQIKLEWIGAGGVVTSDTFTNANPQDVWTKVSVNAVVPAGATGVRFVVICNLPAGGAIMYDNASLINNSQPPSGLVGDVSVSNDPGACGANLELATPATTSCQVTITNDYNGTSNASGFYPIGVTPVTWTVTNSQGQTASCSVNITVEDTETPTLDCSQGANSGNVLVNNSFENGAVFNAPFNTDWNTFGFAPLFAIDANIIPFAQDGNFYLKAFTSNAGLFQEHPVAAGDIIDASIYIGNLGFDPIQPGCEAYIKLEYNNGDVVESIRLDNSLPVNTWNQISLSDVAPAGATSVKYVAVMGCPGAGAVMFDNASMIITGAGLVGNVEVDNDPGACGAQLSLAVPSNGDNCGAILTNDFNGTGDASDFYPVGTTTVTWTITDAQNLSTSCTIDVTVTDAEAPTIDCNVAGPQNLLANNSFENNNGHDTQGAPNWVQFGPVFMLDQNVIGTAQDGDFFAKMFGGNTGLFQDLSVNAGDNITGTVYMQNASFDPTNPNGGGQVKLEWQGVGGVATSDLFTAASPQNVWTEVSVNAVAPAGATGVRFVIICQQPAGGAIMFDNASLINNSQPGPGIVGDVSVNNDPGECGANLALATPTTTDNCSVASITNDYNGTANASGFYPLGTTTVVWTVVDTAGFTATCSVDISVTDNEAPTIDCSQSLSSGNVLNSPSFEDANGNNTPYNSASWSRFGVQPFALDIAPLQDGNFYVKTFGGNTGLFQDHPVSAGDAIEAAIYIGNLAFDPIQSGCETYIKLEYNNGVVVESNRLDGTIPINAWTQIVMTDVAPAGATSVRYVAIMGCPGAGAVMFDNASMTITSPNADLVGDVEVDNDPGACGAQLSLAVPIAGDNCPGATLTNDYNGTGNASDFYPVGTTTVTWTVTDAQNLSTSCTIEVTVEDNEAPVVNCAEITIILDGNGEVNITASDLDLNSTDNCEIASYSISQENFTCADTGGDLDQLIITEYIDGPGANDCIEIYNGTGNSVNLTDYSIAVYADGSTTPTLWPLLGTIDTDNAYVVCQQFSDATGVDLTNGLTLTGNDAVALLDNGNAVDIIGIIGNDPGTGWSAGANQTNNRTLVRNNDVFAGDISNSNAGLASEWTSFPSTNMSGLGAHDIETVGLSNNVLLTVTDIYGNASTCEAAVTVVDDTPPLAVAQDVVVQLDASGNGSTSAVLVNDGSSDVCGIALLELNQTDFTCANVGVPNPVILTVTDVNGNTATAPANVTVIDLIAPDAQAQDVVVVLDANGNGSITATQVNNGSSDACGIATITVSPNIFDCSNVGDNEVTLTVTDVNGNVSTATANVEVQDNTNPTAVCQAYTVTLDATGSATITPADVDGGSEDACGILNYEIDIDTFGCDDLGDNDVVLTVTDNNGNSSSCTAVVTVLGDLPVVDITEAVLPGLCQGDFILLTANSDLGVAWEWFLDGVATGDTTETIEASEDGVYTVDVTSATNCTTAASYTVTGFDLGGLISAYTIVAQDWVYLHGDNLVGSGGVGAMDPGTGNIKLHQTSNVVGFAQAATFNVQAGSTIGTQVIAPANPIIPAFESNTQSNAGSPNVTVNNNATQNLNGSVYGTVTIKQGATVTFTQANVYINEIKTFKDASIEFAGCTNVYINEKFQLAEDGVINSGGNYVTMYVNDDVQIERGSDVRARIHAGDNAMLVKGANGNSTDVTYMTGLFIADTIHGSNEIIWNQDPLCDPCPVDQPLTNPTNDTNNTDNTASREAFDVKAWPNPSNTTFNVQLVSQNINDNATIYVFDMNNKLVHQTQFGAEDKYNFGSNLEGGVYIVKVVQGKNMKYVRLVKY